MIGYLIAAAAGLGSYFLFKNSGRSPNDTVRTGGHDVAPPSNVPAPPPAAQANPSAYAIDPRTFGIKMGVFAQDLNVIGAPITVDTVQTDGTNLESNNTLAWYAPDKSRAVILWQPPADITNGGYLNQLVTSLSPGTYYFVQIRDANTGAMT